MRRAPACRSRRSVGATDRSRRARITSSVCRCRTNLSYPIQERIMPASPNPDDTEVLQAKVVAGPGTPMAARMDAMGKLRAKGAEVSARLDKAILNCLDRHMHALREANGNQSQLREMLNLLTAPPWHPAAFVD